MDSTTENTRTRPVLDEEPKTLPERPDEPDRGEQGRDADALARLSDPSLAARKERIAARVRDRSGMRWVPASELLRRGSERAGDALSRGQERVHRATREGVKAGVTRTASVAAARVAQLGRSRPTPAANDPDLVSTRTVL